jgi:hypothetical protein
MHLEHTLGDVQSDRGNLHGGRLLVLVGSNGREFGTPMPIRGRPPHQFELFETVNVEISRE